MRALILFMKAPPSQPKHFPKTHLPIPSFWGLGFQHKNLVQEETNIQTTATSTLILCM